MATTSSWVMAGGSCVGLSWAPVHMVLKHVGECHRAAPCPTRQIHPLQTAVLVHVVPKLVV